MLARVWLVVVAGVLGAAGCQPTPEAPAGPVLLRPHDQIMLDEITRAARLPGEADRREALVLIAANQRLAAAEQVALIDATFDALRFDSGRERVLLTLIDNPATTRPAAAHLLRSLDRLKLSSSREQVLSALHSRSASGTPFRNP